MLNNYKTKKAQLAILIVVGIIILIVTIFLFSSDEIKLFQSHDTKLKNQISTIVKDCIYKSAENGAYVLGSQAGVIEIPTQIANNPTKYIDFGMKIPNWDTQKGDIPTITSMQNELNNYIKQDSIGCINANLRTLKEVFDIETDIEENFEVNSRINKENIVIESTYLINFNEKNSQEILTISDYTVKLEELRLGELYELAVEIYNTELNTYVFENLIIDQMRSADDYSNQNSMPTEGMIITCGKSIWTLEKLKENLANLNNNNFKYLQFQGTYPKDDMINLNLNEEFGTEKYKEYYEKQYQVKLDNTKSSFKNFNVETFMPSTQITNKDGYFKKYPYRTFEVQPSSGQLVTSLDMELGEATAKIPVPCIQIFHHLYTLDYDLIIKLSDYNEGAQNYFFQFPLRIEIKNNEPKEKAVNYLNVESRTFTKENYCIEENYKYPLLVLTKDTNENSITNVNISYKCMNVECDIGTTSQPTFQGMQRQHADAQLEAKFPFCIGGKIIAKKEGYHSVKQRIETDERLFGAQTYVGNNLIEIEMIPKKIFPIAIDSFLIMPKEVSTSDRISKENDGVAFVSIENKKLDFETQAMWPSEGEFLNKLELLDKENINYNLSVVYLDSNNELKGMLEIQNWTPSIHSGNRIVFKIPSTLYPINKDEYLEFYNYVNNQSNTTTFQPIIY